MSLPNKIWYSKNNWRWFLWPASILFRIAILLRHFYLTKFKQQKFNVPLIVIGNINVGGVGKTPLVIEMCRQLKKYNLRPGIVSRGYKSKLNKKAHLILEDDTAFLVGDEPLLISKKTNCPVVIARNRSNAVNYLINECRCNIIISDDGMQHYTMGRNLEIAVIDGKRQFGNGLCLPAGPLREPISRLKTCDFIVIKGEGKIKQILSNKQSIYHMSIMPGAIRSIITNKVAKPHELAGTVAAVAGIGYPEQFFYTLAKLGLKFKEYIFPNHHPFKKTDLLLKEKIIIMTEKDAIKCQPFATNSWYYLPIEAKLNNSFWRSLRERLAQC